MDRLDPAFFCGSCAVVRRKALDDTGGFATGTVTEDSHTSLKLHKRGWRSVYYARSLAFGQRASYLATMLAYFEGWQRAIFFLAPVLVLTTGTMPIIALDREFLVRFVPYCLLTYWVFEEVARGYGRTLLTEQYTMMRFAVFINATFGIFLRRLHCVVTPKRMGEADATRQSLRPQYLVLGLNAASIPIGLALFWKGGGLPLGALVGNLLWASLTLGVAALSIRFALRTASFKRREYRFPLPVPLRVHGAAGIAIGLATDISPLGCRLVGAPVCNASVGDELRGELLLPTGPLPVCVTVRAPLADGDKGGEAPNALGCEFRWGLSDERNRLAMFLFGSDLSHAARTAQRCV